jgi:hypothetical protein
MPLLSPAKYKLVAFSQKWTGMLARRMEKDQAKEYSNRDKTNKVPQVDTGRERGGYSTKKEQSEHGHEMTPRRNSGKSQVT